MRLALVAVWIVLAAAQFAQADDTEAYVGTTGFGFLKLSPSARPSALGGAFVAVRGDLAGLRWNPALAATLNGRRVSLDYADYLVDTQAGFLAVGWPVGSLGSMGASLYYMSYGDMVRTTGKGDLDTGPSFTPGDVSLECTFARWLGERLALGGSLKAVFSKIDVYSSDAYALDLGVLYDPPITGLSLGASATNLLGGARQGYTSHYKDELPVSFKLGFCHSVAHLPLMLVGEWDGSPNDNSSSFAFGGEFCVADALFLRTGYNDQAADIDNSGRAGWSMGAGVCWRSYRFDYAYSLFAALGNVHRISATASL